MRLKADIGHRPFRLPLLQFVPPKLGAASHSEPPAALHDATMPSNHFRACMGGETGYGLAGVAGGVEVGVVQITCAVIPRKSTVLAL